MLELLVAAALLSLLLAVAAPSLRGIIEQGRGDQAIDSLRSAVELTRAMAISNGGIVTLCRSRDGRTCGGNWEEGMIVFIDSDGDRVPDDANALVRVFRGSAAGGTIRWRSFGNRQFLQMTAMGHTRNQNGNFTWCPASGEARHARQLIVNVAGRMREALDSDGDGIREGSNGRPLACD